MFLSNGPGDPEPCDYAITRHPASSLETEIPVFGICLGHQLLGLASGARTIKMKFGHHGANHPVHDIASGRVLISSQNHGFAVDESDAAGERARPRTARCSTARCRASSAPTGRPSASRDIPRRAPARTTCTPLFEPLHAGMIASDSNRRRGTASPAPDSGRALVRDSREPRCRSAPTSRAS